jgi:RNA polymerase sigma-70 factor (ECF subfamily)
VQSREERAVRSREDVEAAIRGFGAAEWARIDYVARSFTFGTGWDADDLSQEVILRTLRGTRKCPVDVDVMKHLIETMSSVADGERDKARNQLEHRPAVQPGVEDGEDLIAGEWSAEDTMVFEDGRNEILAIFDDDPAAKDLVDGILAEFETDQLKELTGLDGTAYASKRTLIRRRLSKLRPEGKRT